MFYKNKKGLSDIIATVLIVLLAIAAVVIVWGFVSKFLYKGGDVLDTQSKCLEVEVRPISCSNSTKMVKVQVVRGTVTKANAYIMLSDNSVVINNAVIINGLADINLTNMAGNKSANTAKASAIVLDQEGREVSCPESLITVGCV